MSTEVYIFEDFEGAKLFVRICARSGYDFALFRDYDKVYLVNPKRVSRKELARIAAECGGSRSVAVP